MTNIGGIGYAHSYVGKRAEMGVLDEAMPKEVLERVEPLKKTKVVTECEFCDFYREPKEWEIGLYEQTGYYYDGKKYFLEVEYPLGDARQYPKIRPVEVNFCPKCGRRLVEE